MLSLSISLTGGQAKMVGRRAKGTTIAILGSANGTIEADDKSGAITVTVTSPAAYAGTYTHEVDGNALAAASLADGPQALAAPVWQYDEQPTVGAPQPFLQGLWIYDTSRGALTVSYDVLRDGTTVLVDDASYTGSDSYSPVTSDSGASLTIAETASQGVAVRTAVSAALTVAEDTAASVAVVGSTDGTVEINNKSGAITVTVTSPATHAGTYTHDVDGNALAAVSLAGGPQALAAPVWQDDGQPTIGAPQPFLRGLWIYDPSRGALTVSHDVLRDGTTVLVDDASYTGSDSYSPVTGDGGASLTIVETAAQSGNARSASSAALTVPAGLKVIETAEGTIEIDGVTGDITVEITSPAAYAGTYTHDVDGNALAAVSLAGGPQALVAPVWQDDRTPAIGEPQPFLRGLWIYDPSRGALTVSHDVLRDGTTVLVDDASYTGSDSYSPVTGDGGASLTIVETAAQSGNARSASSAALTVPAGLKVIETAEGTIEIDGVTGDITVEITSPAAYAGTYTHDVDGNALAAVSLAGGPQALAAPVWQDDRTPAIGEPQPFLRGLWIYDPSRGALTVSHDVLRDGTTVLVDDASYTGSDSYSPVTGDGGASLTIVETAAQSGNARSASSAALAIPAAPSGLAVSNVGQSRPITSAASTGVYKVAADEAPSFAAGDRVIVIVTGASPNAGHQHKTVRVGEQDMTQIPGAEAHNANRVKVTAWQHTMSVGGTGLTVDVYNWDNTVPQSIAGGGIMVRWLKVSGPWALTDLVTYNVQPGEKPWTATFDCDVAEGGIAIAAAQALGNNATVYDVLTGVSRPAEWPDQAIGTGEETVGTLATNLAALTRRAIAIGSTGTVTIRAAALALALKAA